MIALRVKRCVIIVIKTPQYLIETHKFWLNAQKKSYNGVLFNGQIFR